MAILQRRQRTLSACDTSYFLAAEAKAGAKVMVIMAHNEIERYEQALKRKKASSKLDVR